MIEVTDDSFASEVLGKAGPVLVDFWAEWCPPCKALGPILEKLSTEMAGDGIFAKMDIEACPKTTLEYKINSIPTVVIFFNGKEVERSLGFKKPAFYEEQIKKYANMPLEKKDE